MDSGRLLAPTGAPGIPFYDREAARFGRRCARLDGGDARLDGGHARFDGGHARFERGHARLDGGHARLDGGHARLGGGRARLGGGRARLDGGHAQLDGGDAWLGGGDGRFNHGNARFGWGNGPFGRGDARLESGNGRLRQGNGCGGLWESALGGEGEARSGCGLRRLESGHLCPRAGGAVGRRESSVATGWWGLELKAATAPRQSWPRAVRPLRRRGLTRRVSTGGSPLVCRRRRGYPAPPESRRATALGARPLTRAESDHHSASGAPQGGEVRGRPLRRGCFPPPHTGRPRRRDRCVSDAPRLRQYQRAPCSCARTRWASFPPQESGLRPRILPAETAPGPHTPGRVSSH